MNKAIILTLILLIILLAGCEEEPIRDEWIKHCQICNATAEGNMDMAQCKDIDCDFMSLGIIKELNT